MQGCVDHAAILEALCPAQAYLKRRQNSQAVQATVKYRSQRFVLSSFKFWQTNLLLMHLVYLSNSTHKFKLVAEKAVRHEFSLYSVHKNAVFLCFNRNFLFSRVRPKWFTCPMPPSLCSYNEKPFSFHSKLSSNFRIKHVTVFCSAAFKSVV